MKPKECYQVFNEIAAQRALIRVESRASIPGNGIYAFHLILLPRPKDCHENYTVEILFSNYEVQALTRITTDRDFFVDTVDPLNDVGLEFGFNADRLIQTRLLLESLVREFVRKEAEENGNEIGSD